AQKPAQTRADAMDAVHYQDQIYHDQNIRLSQFQDKLHGTLRPTYSKGIRYPASEIPAGKEKEHLRDVFLEINTSTFISKSAPISNVARMVETVLMWQQRSPEYNLMEPGSVGLPEHGFIVHLDQNGDPITYHRHGEDHYFAAEVGIHSVFGPYFYFPMYHYLVFYKRMRRLPSNTVWVNDATEILRHTNLSLRHSFRYNRHVYMLPFPYLAAEMLLSCVGDRGVQILTKDDKYLLLPSVFNTSFNPHNQEVTMSGYGALYNIVSSFKEMQSTSIIEDFRKMDCHPMVKSIQFVNKDDEEHEYEPVDYALQLHIAGEGVKTLYVSQILRQIRLTHSERKFYRPVTMPLEESDESNREINNDETNSDNVDSDAGDNDGINGQEASSNDATGDGDEDTNDHDVAVDGSWEVIEHRRLHEHDRGAYHFTSFTELFWS
ncbi:MAG: hypothetical protein AAFO91_00615, partial [Bacteroidota bacterium]